MPMRKAMPRTQCTSRKLTGEVRNQAMRSPQTASNSGSMHRSTQHPCSAGSSVSSSVSTRLTCIYSRGNLDVYILYRGDLSISSGGEIFIHIIFRIYIYIIFRNLLKREAVFSRQ